MKKNFLLLFIVILSAFQASVAQRLPITVYDSDSRLSVGGISCFQDSEGWMWFTNGYELMRYDGYQLKSFPPVSGFLMRNCFQVMEVDHEKWVLSDTHILKVSGDSLQPIIPLKTGMAIIGHLRHQQRELFLTRTGLFEYSNKKFDLIAKLPGFELYSEATLLPYNDTLLVSFQHNKKLLIFNLQNKTIDTIPLLVKEIGQDDKGEIYLLTERNGIVLLDKITSTPRQTSIQTEVLFPLTGGGYDHFALGREGNFWVSKPNVHLALLSPGKPMQIFTERNGLPNLSFGQMMTDREKNIWVGFVGGLFKIRQQDWKRFTKSDGLHSNNIHSLSKDSAHRIFVLSQVGLNAIAGNQVVQVRSDDENPFVCNQLLPKGDFCYYSRHNSLYTAELDAIRFKISRENKIGEFSSSIGSLKTDKYNNPFILTRSGIYVYYKKKVQELIHTDSSGDVIRQFYIDSHDRLWAGKFSAELSCYKLRYDTGIVGMQKLFSVTSIGNSLPPLRGTRAIAEDNQGLIFVGTRYNGLYILKMQKDKVAGVQHFDEKAGLASNSIWDVSFDKFGNCWIANAKGLSKMTLLEGQWICSDEGAGRDIQASHHVLAGDEAVWTDDFPGITSISYETTATTHPFWVNITGIIADGQPVAIKGKDHHYRFDYDQNNLRINFSANTYINEGAVLYSYYLKGSGVNEWSDLANLHSINFSSLKAGKYVLDIRAKNVNGKWSENTAVVSFEILLPIWKRAWFIGLTLLLVAAGFYLLYRNRIRRLREMVAIRTRIARDLHDEVGSALSVINILSKASHQYLQNGSDKAGALLEKVIDQSDQIQQSMSDIVWAIQPNNDSVKNMLVRIREYLSHTLEPRNIAFDLSIDKKIEQETLNIQQRKDFFLILKETVHNMVRHSNCHHARIELRSDGGFIHLLITDDGAGFNIAKADGGNGLANLQQRAASLKGRLEIQTAPGAGSRIELIFPTS